jgi:hypothetical protein
VICDPAENRTANAYERVSLWDHRASVHITLLLRFSVGIGPHYRGLACYPGDGRVGVFLEVKLNVAHLLGQINNLRERNGFAAPIHHQMGVGEEGDWRGDEGRNNAE